MTEPTIDECFAAGKGPEQSVTYSEGGLSNTPEERARFEAYMRGHCWEIGNYDESLNAYDTVLVRMLYGVWRDRGALCESKRKSLDAQTLAWRCNACRQVGALHCAHPEDCGNIHSTAGGYE